MIMQTPLQVTFRGTDDPTGAMTAKINEHIEKLDAQQAGVIGCQVTVEAPHHTHHKGNLYQVRINLTVPGHQFTVVSEPKHNHAHEDVYVCIRDAFDAMLRQLHSFREIQQGDVKTHATLPLATVSVLVPEKDYGRMVSEDGHDIYFHRNSVANSRFDALKIGSTLEYEMEMGDKGLQATYAKVIAI